MTSSEPSRPTTPEPPAEGGDAAHGLTAPKPPATTAQEQTLIWLIEGIREGDIRQALRTAYPKANPDALLNQAADHFQTVAEADPEVVRGWALEAFRELYRKMYEIGDFTGALRAAKELLKYAMHPPQAPEAPPEPPKKAARKKRAPKRANERKRPKTAQKRAKTPKP